MGPTWSRKDGRSYRYYLCVGAAKNGYASCPVRSVAAGEVERAVVDQLRAMFRAPEVVARTYREAKAREAEDIERRRREQAVVERQLRTLDAKTNGNGTLEQLADVQRCLAALSEDLRALKARAVTERDVIDALERLDPLWDDLFPTEQERIVCLLVERVDVEQHRLEVRIRAEGLKSLVAEMAWDGDERLDRRTISRSDGASSVTRPLLLREGPGLSSSFAIFQGA
jgi:site-specific DNA recombinase